MVKCVTACGKCGTEKLDTHRKQRKLPPMLTGEPRFNAMAMDLIKEIQES